MSPVADTDLATYNKRLCDYIHIIKTHKSATLRHGQDQSAIAEMSSSLRTYYGCLTAALIYLHDQNIRHKDVKPQNILVSKGNILFTDFGLSRDFGDDIGSTTSGLTPASPRYCAPEVASYEARNTSSDVWSLGCVFLEMTAALRGLSIEWIKDYFAKHGSGGIHFHANHAATMELVQNFRAGGDSKNARVLTWIETMLRYDRSARPTAARVMEMITLPDAGRSDSASNKFCGICCVPDYESDSLDSLAEEIDDDMTDEYQTPTVFRSDTALQTTTTARPPMSDTIPSTMSDTIPSVVSDNTSSSVLNSETPDEVTQRLWENNTALLVHPKPETTRYATESSQTEHLSDVDTTTTSLQPYTFGLSLDLGTQYSGDRRLTSRDFGIALNVTCLVPNVVARCCMFIINSGERFIYSPWDNLLTLD